MINILHVTYDMRIGGTEMVIKNIIEGNTDTNIDMSIYCIESPLGPWGEELATSGITITTQARKPGFDTSLIKAIRQHIKDNNIDILHCHQYTPWVYGALAAAFTRTKVIFTEHGRFYPDSSSWKRKIVNPILLRLTSKITAISVATKKALVEYECIPSRKIEVVYNGISPLNKVIDTAAIKEKFGVSTKSFIFGTVARLDPIKNQTMLLKAFSTIADNRKDVFLFIVGDGEMRKELEQLTITLNLEKNVIFTGYRSAPSDLINMFDIFLLSSLSEGTSMTLLEAMSLGKPCVVTNAGGNPEVIEHEYNGIVCENDDQEAFSRACFDMIDRDLSEIRKNSLQRFDEKFSVQSMLSHYNRIWKNL